MSTRPGLRSPGTPRSPRIGGSLRLPTNPSSGQAAAPLVAIPCDNKRNSSRNSVAGSLRSPVSPRFQAVASDGLSDRGSELKGDPQSAIATKESPEARADRENAELKMKIKVLETAQKRLSLDVDSQRKEKAEHMASLLEAQAQERRLHEKLADSDAMVSKLQTQVEEQEKAHQRLHNKVDSLQRQSEQQGGKLADWQNECEVLMAELELMRTERHEQTVRINEMEGMRRRLSSTIDAQRKEKELQANKLADADSVRNILQEQLEKQRREKVKQSARLVELQQARERLLKYVKTQEKRIAAMEITSQQEFVAESGSGEQSSGESGSGEQGTEQDEEETERVEIVPVLRAEDTDFETAAIKLPSKVIRNSSDAGVSCSDFMYGLSTMLQKMVQSRNVPTSSASAEAVQAAETSKAVPLASIDISLPIFRGQDVATNTEDIKVIPPSARFGGPPMKEEGENLVVRLANAEAVITGLRWQAEAWRQPLHHPVPLARLPPLRLPLPDRSLHVAAEAMLHMVCCSGRCRPAGTAKVLHVRPIINDMQWQSYQNSRESMRVQHLRTLSGAPTPISPDVPAGVREHFPWIAQSLDSSLNERLVFHGTPPDFVEQIAQRGFDERLANLSGLYGAGIYFAEQSCKAFHYSGSASVRCLLLTRVLMGQPHFATGPMRAMRRPPLLDASDPQKGLYDSVVADLGTPTGRSGDELKHRVCVLFEGKQAYPEMAIYFEMGNAA